MVENFTLQVNKAMGKIGENFLANTYGGAQQVFRRTSSGGRYVDNLVDGIAMESKVGRTALSKRIRTQIAKDLELMKTSGSGITNAQWHFFKGQSGIGPTKALQKALEKAGIKIIIH